MGKRKGALEMNGFDEFKQTNFYPPLKSLEKLWSPDKFRKNRSSLIRINSLNIRDEIWRQSPTC